MRTKLTICGSSNVNRGSVKTKIKTGFRTRLPQSQTFESGGFRLLEDGFFRLLEDGGKRLLE